MDGDRNDGEVVRENEQPRRKRPSARPFYKDIGENFIGYAELAGIYNLILLKVAWGSHTTKLRKYHDTESSQFITTLDELKILFGKDGRQIKRSLSILEYMGAITIERRSKHCLVISNTNECHKTAKEADEIVPNARFFINKVGKCPDSRFIESWQMPILKVGKCPDSIPTEMGKCPDSNTPKWAIAQIHDFPSLYEKKKGEEEIIRREREEEPIFPLLKKGDLPIIPPQVSVRQVISSLKNFSSVPVKAKENRPPGPQDIIGVNWYTWALKNDPTLSYRLEEYISAVLDLNYHYPFTAIDKLLSYVAQSGYFAPKFLTPNCLDTTFKDGSSLVGSAFAEMKGKGVYNFA